MALAKTGYSVTATLQDLGSNRSTMQFFVDPGEALADVVSAAAGLMSALDAVTDAAIVGYRVSEVYEDSAATPAGEIEEQALLVVSTNDGQKALMRIPAPNVGIFAAASGPNYNVVDINDATLQLYIDEFQAGAGVEFLVSDGQTVNQLISGKRIHRGSTHG